MTELNKEPLTLPKVESSIQVRFSDTDAMGHISSGSYAAFAEVGRAAFFREIPDAREDIPWFVLRHLEMEFISEARFGQEITLSTRCGKITDRTIRFDQVVRADGKVACTLKVVHVAFDPKSRTSMQVPAHWRIEDEG